MGDLANKPRPPTLDILGAGLLTLPCLDGVANLEPAANLWSSVSLLGVELADSGLGGWLPFLPTYLGGCGKAPILTVFRRVLPGGNGPAGESFVASVGTLEAEFVWPLGIGRRGNDEDDTARVATAGDGSSEDEGARSVGPTFDARDFATGNDGRGPVGGAIEGRDGRGSVLAMVLSSQTKSLCCSSRSSKGTTSILDPLL